MEASLFTISGWVPSLSHAKSQILKNKYNAYKPRGHVVVLSDFFYLTINVLQLHVSLTRGDGLNKWYFQINL